MPHQVPYVQPLHTKIKKKKKTFVRLGETTNYRKKNSNRFIGCGTTRANENGQNLLYSTILEK